MSPALRKFGKAKLVDMLMAEVNKGTCGIRQSKDGTLKRVVPITLLQLGRQDGFILVQLGKLSSDQSAFSIAPCLPGHKISTSIAPKEGLMKFLYKRFPWAFVEATRKGCLEMTVDSLEDHGSRTFPLGTISSIYVRSLFSCHLPHGFRWDRYFIEVPVNMQTLKFRGSSDRRCLRGSGCLAKRLNATNAAEHLAPQIFLCREHQAELYAWLPTWEFEWIKNSEVGKEALRTWLSDLKLPSLPQQKIQMTPRTRKSMMPTHRSRSVWYDRPMTPP